jgi:1-acyl-sn-glycerol-3-phosphate acyltransferase
MSFYWFVKWFLFGPIVRLLCRLELEGRENLPEGGGYVLASNHLKWYDPVLIPVYLPHRISFAAKSELFEYPVLRQILRRTGMISLKRQNATRRERVEFIRQAEAKLNQGVVFGIFPEGTRSRDGKLREFMTGVGTIASRTRCPIVPVGVSYYRKGLRLTVRIVIGTPIDSNGSHSERLTLELRRRIAACSGQELAGCGITPEAL